MEIAKVHGIIRAWQMAGGGDPEWPVPARAVSGEGTATLWELGQRTCQGALHSADVRGGGFGWVRSCWVISEYLVVVFICPSQQQLFEVVGVVSILQTRSSRPRLVITCPKSCKKN